MGLLRAAGTTIVAGGSETVSAGGIDHGARISGGTQYDYGSASGDMIFGGGAQVVYAGGITSDITINSGGVEVVFSGGTAVSTTIDGALMEIVKGGSTGSRRLASRLLEESCNSTHRRVSTA
jgi:autotransporter passenger strand-loop-strand repeat protein